jgi:hypothetical protein
MSGSVAPFKGILPFCPARKKLKQLFTAMKYTTFK